ncbi:MAG: three-Cys-motif partner protein TcmP, partial [Terracidiphilus sp.]
MTDAESLRVDDDGLVCGEVGRWAETKYRLIALYDQLFANGMKYKWDHRVYIDLYAGSGYSRIRGTEIRLMGSPILALNVSSPFDKYIFCEENPILRSALEIRSRRIAPSADITFIPGSCDSEIDKIVDAIPKGSKSNT